MKRKHDSPRSQSRGRSRPKIAAAYKDEKFWNFDIPWDIQLKNEINLPKQWIHPEIEFTRAKAIQEIRNYFVDETAKRFPEKISEDPINRWMFQQLSIPKSKRDLEELSDPILPAISAVKDSDVIRTEIGNSLPASLYIPWNERKNPTNRSKSIIRTFIYKAKNLMNKPKNDDDEIDLNSSSTSLRKQCLDTLQYAESKANQNLSPNLLQELVDRLKQDCNLFFRDFFRKDIDQLADDITKKGLEKIKEIKDKIKEMEQEPIPFKDIITVTTHEHTCKISYADKDTVDITATSYNKLKQLYTIHSSKEDPELERFNVILYCIARRYQTFFGQVGATYHAAAPPATFQVLTDKFGICQENFASPFNCYYSKFNSAFPDIDVFFGSLGSFFDMEPIQGSFETGPPYVNEVMIQMAKRLEELLTNSDLPLSFVVFVPEWRKPVSEYHIILENSKFLVKDILKKGREYYYVKGNQHHAGADQTPGEGRYFILPFETHIYVLQNEAGKKKWPITNELMREFEKSFSL